MFEKLLCWLDWHRFDDFEWRQGQPRDFLAMPAGTTETDHQYAITVYSRCKMPTKREQAKLKRL